jgi:hypothetical protein
MKLSKEQLASWLCHRRGLPPVGPEREFAYQVLLQKDINELWREYCYYDWLDNLKSVAQKEKEKQEQEQKEKQSEC